MRLSRMTTLFNLASALVRSPLRSRTTVLTRMTVSDDALALEAPDIAILGGGFGGLYTALRLNSLDWDGGPKPRVTLVDRRDRFTFLPMLYELATGSANSWEVSPKFSDLIKGTDIHFIQAEVTSLDLQSRLVGLSETSSQTPSGSPRNLAFDACVIAMGSEPIPVSINGASFARPFYSREDAIALRQELLRRWPTNSTQPPLRVSVVGGGYIGVELAANLARWSRDRMSQRSEPPLEITLVNRREEILEASKPFNRKVAAAELSRLGVRSIPESEVVALKEGLVQLKPRGGSGGELEVSSSDLEADVVVWAAGSRPSSLPRSLLGLPTDSAGRVITDKFLRVSGNDGKVGDGLLFALGDVATCGQSADVSSTVPSTAQAAMQQADYVAWNLRAALRKDKLLPFRYQDLGEMVSLGDDAASVSALGLVHLEGPLAALSRRAVYAARMPTANQAVSVGTSWAIQVVRRALERG